MKTKNKTLLKKKDSTIKVASEGLFLKLHEKMDAIDNELNQKGLSSKRRKYLERLQNDIFLKISDMADEGYEA